MDKKFRSQAQIADFLGIPRRTLSSYCTGHRRIGNLDTRKKLLELTGIEFFKSDMPDIQEVNALNEWMNSVIDRSMRNRRDIGDTKDTGDMKDIDDSDDIDDNNGASDTNNGGRPFLDMMSELRNWFNNQNRWSTKKEFADDIGIPRSTMKKIFLGVRWPKEEYRQKLYEITGLECFKDINQKESQTQEIDTISNMETGIKIDQEKKLVDIGQQEQTGQMTEESKLSEESKLLIEQVEHRNDKPNNLKESVTKHILVGHGDEVDKLAKAFYSLARALEPFKHGTPEQREKVKNRIPAEDLGYIISFMKAMYDEDHFADFMFFSEYKLKGGNGDRK